jgi:hypothetical protein
MVDLQWKNVQSRNKNNGVQRSKIKQLKKLKNTVGKEVVVWAK